MHSGPMSAYPAHDDRWLVMKFGGTSVSKRARWDNIGRLADGRARDQDARVLVVVSALSGVTNELTAIADGAADAAERVARLELRHREFLAELELDADDVLGARLSILHGLVDDPRAAERPLEWQAEVLGQGELLSSTLGAAYLRSRGLPLAAAQQLLTAAFCREPLSVIDDHALRESLAARVDIALGQA